MENKGRTSIAIQVMRGFGIIMVCLHHTLNNVDSSSYTEIVLKVAQADVTVFFVISGFLFQAKYKKYSNDPLIFIKRKIRELIVPYIFWSGIIFVGGV